MSGIHAVGRAGTAMSYFTRVLAWVQEVRGEPVATILANCDEDELDAYKASLERSAALKGESLPELPSLEAATETLGVPAPETDQNAESQNAPGSQEAAPPAQAETKPAARTPDGRMTAEQLAEMARRRGQEGTEAGSASAAASGTSTVGTEKERRGRALSRVARLMKSAAEQLREAPIERLEAFANTLEESFQTLSGDSGGPSRAQQPSAQEKVPPPSQGQRPTAQAPAQAPSRPTQGAGDRSASSAQYQPKRP